MTQIRKLAVLAALLAVAIVASGWFLLVSPKRGEASDLRAQTSSVEAANANLSAKLKQLQALAPELPKREAELAAIRRQIPNNPALPDLVRQLTSAADRSGADLLKLAPATPIPLVVAAPAAATATAATTTAPATSEQLLQVPMTLSLSGSYSELEDFVGQLEELHRAMLVTGFTLSSPKATDATKDDIQLDVSGRVFMVHAAAAAAPVTTGSTGAAATSQPAN